MRCNFVNSLVSHQHDNHEIVLSLPHQGQHRDATAKYGAARLSHVRLGGQDDGRNLSNRFPYGNLHRILRGNRGSEPSHRLQDIQHSELQPRLGTKVPHNHHHHHLRYPAVLPKKHRVTLIRVSCFDWLLRLPYAQNSFRVVRALWERQELGIKYRLVETRRSASMYSNLLHGDVVPNAAVRGVRDYGVPGVIRQNQEDGRSCHFDLLRRLLHGWILWISRILQSNPFGKCFDELPTIASERCDHNWLHFIDRVQLSIGDFSLSHRACLVPTPQEFSLWNRFLCPRIKVSENTEWIKRINWLKFLSIGTSRWPCSSSSQRWYWAFWFHRLKS